jgi:hypothetical protein
MAHALCGSQLIGLAAWRGCLHLLQFGARSVFSDGLRMPGLRFQAGRALAARFRQIIRTAGVARERTSAGQFSIQAGPCGRVRQRSHLFAEAFTLPLSSGVTIISIVPNGQATTQALQPMHFC